MAIFYSPIDVNKYNIFEKIKGPGVIERFLATNDMELDDILIFHVGKQNPNYESGVYAYGKVVKEPYILENHPEDYCNNQNTVDVEVIDIRYDKPFIPFSETKDFIEPYQSRHRISEQYHSFLLKKLNYKVEELSNFSLADDFKEIFDRFEEEKQKEFKGNELASKMRNEFNIHFNQFISDLVSSDYDYICKISPGVGKWVNSPWADIRTNETSTSFQDGFYIYSHFDLLNKKLEIGFIQGQDKVPLNRRLERWEFLEEKMVEKFPDTFFNLESGEDYIIVETLAYDDLTNENIGNVYKKLINIYEGLIHDFRGFVKSEPAKKSDLRPEEDSSRIWRIAPGDADISINVWEEFKKESYVGVGFDYIGDESIDYTSFKNKLSLDKYLDKFDVKTPSKSMIWRFVNWIRKGDIIVVNKGRSKFAGIGVVTGSFIPCTENENKNEYGLNNIFPVKWIYTPDDLEVPKNFFARHTLVEWHGDKWNQLLCIIARNDDSLKEKILKNIYDESYKIYFESEDNHHRDGYKKESKIVNKAWDEIVEKYENGEEIHDDVWDKLVNRDFKVQIDAVKDIKSALKSRLDLSDEDLKETAILLFKTLKDLKDNKDEEEQKRILKEYAESKYSRGFKNARFSSLLHYLDNYYYIINYKSIETVRLLSLILGDRINLHWELEYYIEDNKRYHEFLEKLKNAFIYPNFDISEYDNFDAICHYLCSNSSIHYAGKNADLIPIDFYIDVEEILNNGDDIDSLDDGEFGEENIGGEDEIEDDDYEYNYELLNLTPKILESKLKSFSIAESTVNQLCASLNAGKNIILDGTPGTGKTELAIKFSTAASENNFIDGYILTTATSDWSTFDTIGGLMPNEKGELFFYPGKFLDAIAENKWLIIDEINRADIDKAFGQLFTVLSKQDVELPYKENDKPIKIKLWDENYSKYDVEKSTYFIGNNWRIIGTMNVDDKDSLFDLSYAFMRRFMFIEVDLPEENAYKRLIRMWSNDLSEEYLNKLLRVYDVIKFRKLGPAIFKDMIEYIKFRDEISDDSTDLILSEAISSYIVPQFEGLNRNKVEQIRKLIGDIGLSSYLDEELEALIPKF